MASKKTAIIEQLFAQRFDATSRSISNAVVTFDDLHPLLDESGLSTNNKANFFKDIVRSRSRNSIFPASVVSAGFTGEQYIGSEEGGCFRFIPLPDGQDVAFDDFVPDPDLRDSVREVQSLSLNLASRLLGRTDESWLTQVAATLNLVATHLALSSNQRNLLSVDLLQTNVKLGNAEVDALFLGQVESDGSGTYDRVLISAEMKHRNEMLEPEQIERGAKAAREHASRALGDTLVPVIPMAVKALDDGHVWIVEFSEEFPPLTVASQALYRLSPPVRGISSE